MDYWKIESENHVGLPKSQTSSMKGYLAKSRSRGRMKKKYFSFTLCFYKYFKLDYLGSVLSNTSSSWWGRGKPNFQDLQCVPQKQTQNFSIARADLHFSECLTVPLIRFS